MENTRFYKDEEKNHPDFTATLAANGEIFVNDAFSAAHRAHASTEGLARLLPAYAGRTMQAELEALEAGLGNPQRPVVAIVGGAKVSTKIDLLMNLVKKVDALVIGGGMANTFLAARGTNVGKSLCEHDLADTAKQIMIEAASAVCAIVLPSDGVVAKEFKAGAASEVVDIEKVPADGMILDVGPKTVEAINAWIDRAATLVWNGPLGAFEIEPFDKATMSAAETCGQANQGRQADLGRRRRRHSRGVEPGRRGRRLHLCLHRRRRLPRMDGRQGPAGRRGAEALSSRRGTVSELADRGCPMIVPTPTLQRYNGQSMSRLLPLLTWLAFPVYVWQGVGVRLRTERMVPAQGPVLHRIEGNDPEIRLLVLGDSSAASVGIGRSEDGLAAQLGRLIAERTGRAVTWRAAGFSSATSGQLRDFAVPNLAPEPWTHIVLTIGTNDAKNFHSVPRFKKAFGGLLYALRAKWPEARIIWSPVIDFTLVPAMPPSLGQDPGNPRRRDQSHGRAAVQ